MKFKKLLVISSVVMSVNIIPQCVYASKSEINYLGDGETISQINGGSSSNTVIVKKNGEVIKNGGTVKYEGTGKYNTINGATIETAPAKVEVNYLDDGETVSQINGGSSSNTVIVKKNGEVIKNGGTVKYEGTGKYNTINGATIKTTSAKANHLSGSASVSQINKANGSHSVFVKENKKYYQTLIKQYKRCEEYYTALIKKIRNKKAVKGNIKQLEKNSKDIKSIVKELEKIMK